MSRAGIAQPIWASLSGGPGDWEWGLGLPEVRRERLAVEPLDDAQRMDVLRVACIHP